MENIMDYLRWRGDLSFKQDAFNDVDNLLLSGFSYVDLREVFEGAGEKELPLSLVCTLYFDRMQGKKLHLGALLPPSIFDMMKLMAESPRFASVRLTAVKSVARDDPDGPDGQAQWSALTFLFEDQTMYIAFSGTDDTLVGWKEDFNMAIYSTIPSQREAEAYVRQVALAYPDYKVRLGGHSKGGNLAIYSAAKCGQDVQDRIMTVYANDAPGFPRAFLADPDYRRVKDRVRLILPDQAFVGLLLYHDARRTVVKSSEKSVRQHDCFTWLVEKNHFEEAEGLSGEALLLRKAVLAWMNDMTLEERKAFIETVYRVLTVEAGTVTELVENRATLLRSYKNLEPEQRQIIRAMLKRLLKSGKQVYTGVLQTPAPAVKEVSPPKKSVGKPTFVTHFSGSSLRSGKPSGAKKKKD